MEHRNKETLGMMLYTLLFGSLFASLISRSQILMLVFFVLWLFSAFRKDNYITIPILSVFCNELQIPFVGIGLFRYGILLLLFLNVVRPKVSYIEKSRALQIAICLLFTIFVLVPAKDVSVLMYIPVMVYFAILWKEIEGNREKAKQIFESFTITMIISIIVGLIQERTSTELSTIGSNYMELPRFFATFNDPNYAALFINAAICMCLGMKLFPKTLRIIILGVLYIGMLMTVSMTAILCNIIVLFALRVMKYGIRLQFITTIIVGTIALVGLYFYALSSDIQVLNVAATRIHLKIIALFEDNNVAAFTSGRAGLTAMHWNYLLEHGSIINWLIGGIPSTALYCTPEIGGHMAHLEYLDLILNIGIIGMAFYLGCIITRFRKSIKQITNTERKTINEIALVKSALYLNYLVCSFSLSLFMEPQFFVWIFM